MITSPEEATILVLIGIAFGIAAYKVALMLKERNDGKIK